jgi:hypothetical protein
MGPWLIAVLVCISAVFVQAETLDDWQKTFNEPATQRKMLESIFPDQIESAAPVKNKEGLWLFEKQSKLAAVRPKHVIQSSGLIVTVLIYSDPDQPPLSAVSYLFRDTYREPIALSDGWAPEEKVESITLKGINKSFILVEDLFVGKDARPVSSRAALLDVSTDNGGTGFRTAWQNDSSVQFFVIGFAAPHQTEQEDLVVKSFPPPSASDSNSLYGDSRVFGNAANTYSGSSSTRYMAYRWTGSRFEPEDLQSENWLKSLPDSAWQYSPLK